MNDEQFFLANAYLDGELTAEERAIAEADPVVMAEVEELRALQALVRDVEPAAEATREAAIAGAMAEFRPAAAATVAADRPVARPVPIRSRRAASRYLAVAAGVVAVGVLGVAVANLQRDGGDDAAEVADQTSMEAAADEPAAEPAEDSARITESEQPATEMAVADEPAADQAADEPAAELPAAEEPAAGGTDRPELVPDQVLTTPEELGSFGTGLLEQLAAGTLPATPEYACPVPTVLARAEYDTGDAVVPVLVAVDEAAGLVRAYDDDTCDLVAVGPLYQP